MAPDPERDEPIPTLPGLRPRTSVGRLAENFRRREEDARRRLDALDPEDRFPVVPMSQAARIYADLDEVYVAASVVRMHDPEIVRLRRLERRAAVAVAAEDTL